MIVFNQTFSSDRPIYFPQSWESGKTQLQLYQQWKLTTQYAVISNILQVLAAGGWIFILAILVMAVKNIKRLLELHDQSRQKRQNKKYLKLNFLIPVGILSLICVAVTIVLVFKEEFTRNALMKGLVFWLVVLLIHKLYNKYKPGYLKWQKRRNQVKKGMTTIPGDKKSF